MVRTEMTAVRATVATLRRRRTRSQRRTAQLRFFDEGRPAFYPTESYRVFCVAREEDGNNARPQLDYKTTII